MSQNAEAPMQLTTMTNVAAALQQAVEKSPNLKDALITLRVLGVSPSELRYALGPLADNPQIRASLELASGPDYIKSFDALDPERRAESLEEWRGALLAARRAKEWAEELDAPAEKSEHASKLGSALDKAHTFEEKVHAFEDHFAAGGAIWETAEALGLSREEAKAVKDREKELSEEWGRQHQGEREKVAAELLRRGVAKDKEEADRMAKQREDAQRNWDNIQRLEKEGKFDNADPERLKAEKQAAKNAAVQHDFGMRDYLATDASQRVKADSPSGAASKEKAKVASVAAASDDEFASLGEPAPAVASVDIKGKLASMRNAEASAPASKGPSLA